MKYAIYNTDTGEILRAVQCSEENIDAQLSEGQAYIATEEVFDDVTHYVENSLLVAKSLQPDEHHTFDWGTKTWVDLRSLVQKQDALRDQVTTKRWEVETGGVTLPGGIIVGSEKSDQDRITSVIVNAELAGIESVDFKAKSGWVTLTVQEIKSIAVAIAQHVQLCFTAERLHHEAIGNLNLGTIDSYNVNLNWPT